MYVLALFVLGVCVVGVSLFGYRFPVLGVGAQVLCGSGFCVFGAVFGVLGCVGGRFFCFLAVVGGFVLWGWYCWGGFFYLVDVVLLAFVFLGAGFLCCVGRAVFVSVWLGVSVSLVCFCVPGGLGVSWVWLLCLLVWVCGAMMFVYCFLVFFGGFCVCCAWCFAGWVVCFWWGFVVGWCFGFVCGCVGAWFCGCFAGWFGCFGVVVWWFCCGC